jgi:plasmid maintenance system antidote protein VapI
MDLMVTEVERIGVSRKHLAELLNGRSGISPELANCLSNAFD